MLPARIKDTNSSFQLQEQTCQRFTLAEIQSATHNFDDALVIGRGGFGNVYRSSSLIGSVSEVAIKRLDSISNQGVVEYEAEIKVLSKLRHCNLVSLIGYCNDKKEMVLVYEFMPNGTLADHLHKFDTDLSWLERLKICIGAARGLDYLHTGIATRHGITHRDVKSSNILLDVDFAAKISDFGLAKEGPTNQTRSHVSTGVKGTFGYMDPCYFNSGKLTRKSDVYAFGVVLFEVLSGKQAVDSTLDEEQWSLAAWARDKIKEGKVNQIVDFKLIGQISRKCLKEFASIATQCLHDQPKQRPTMAEVVVKLESILSQERKSVDSAVNQGRFINTVRSFFAGKADLRLAGEVGSKSNNRGLRTFTYAELVTATNNFQDEEHSLTLPGIIYKGWVDKRTYAPTACGVGLAMYVRKKRSWTSKLDLKPEEFDHPNLIKLLGYCLKEQELFCVYELIPGTSLDKHLFGGQGTNSLSWAARLKIAIGAAEGLSFLHQRKHAAYMQFKTNLIWLDTDFNARLSDFEVEHLVDIPYVRGCFGKPTHYAAPGWFESLAADKLDGFPSSALIYKQSRTEPEIYTFGVILLEILTGKQNPLERQIYTPYEYDKVILGVIMDPQLRHNNYPPKGAFELALLVSKCLYPYPGIRPLMEEILQVLYQCYEEGTISG